MKNETQLRPLSRQFDHALAAIAGSADMRLARCILAVLLVVIVLAPSRANATVVLNNLQQIGLAAHNFADVLDVDGAVSLSCSDGSVGFISGPFVTCGDGSVHRVSGGNSVACQVAGITDGTSNTLILAETGGTTGVVCSDGSVREAAPRTAGGETNHRFILPSLDQATVCFDNPIVGGTVKDGTSNTILFGEKVGLPTTPGFLGALAPVRSFSDGTSNTIFFGELPAKGFCFGNTTIGTPFVGDGGDGGSVFVGNGADFNACFKTARIGISDGTSNTILFGEEQSNVCVTDVTVGADLAAAGIPEPASLVLLLPGAALVIAMLRRRSTRRLG